MMRIYIITLAIFMISSSLAKNLVGYSNQNQKIAGGEDAEQGQFPYQVRNGKIYTFNTSKECANSLEVLIIKSQKSTLGIYFKVSLGTPGGGRRCDGTIYSESLIITSASCCNFINKNYTMKYYEVIAGDLILSDNSGLEQRSKIKDYLIHPDYDVGHLQSQLG